MDQQNPAKTRTEIWQDIRDGKRKAGLFFPHANFSIIMGIFSIFGIVASLIFGICGIVLGVKSLSDENEKLIMKYRVFAILGIIFSIVGIVMRLLRYIQ